MAGVGQRVVPGWGHAITPPGRSFVRAGARQEGPKLIQQSVISAPIAPAPQPAETPVDPRRLLARGLTVAGLAGIALVHLVELPDTWHETAGLGLLFTILVVASALVAAGLLHTDTPRLWLAASLVAAAPIAGYLLTRSTSVPFDHDDVGNWLEPLVLVALFIEASVLGLCGYTWRGRR